MPIIKEDELVGVPFQVESLIKSMLDGKENIHVRGNFRNRLTTIRDAIDKSIRVYDNELGKENATRKPLSRRRR